MTMSSRLELLDRETWREFFEAPAAVLMLGNLDFGKPGSDAQVTTRTLLRFFCTGQSMD